MSTRIKKFEWLEDDDDYFDLEKEEELEEDCSLEKESEPEEDSSSEEEASFSSEEEEDFTLEKQLDVSLRWDEVDRFLDYVTCLSNASGEYLGRGQEFLIKACKYSAYKCVTALLNGETPLIFDVNQTTRSTLPIHQAVVRCDAGMIELLLYRGARTDIRLPFICGDDFLYLPLHGALHFAGFCSGDHPWKPAASIYQLAAFICLPRWQDALECVELLAWNTDKVELEFLRYAIRGEHLYLAVLLAVARKRLAAAIHTAREYLISDFTDRLPKDEKEKLALLLDVFEKAGDALETFIRKRKHGVFVKEISDDVAALLRDKGFHVGPNDTDLSCLQCSITGFCYGYSDVDEISEINKDVGMEHYGTSGHRWSFYNQQSIDCEVRLDEPNKPSRRSEITEEQKCQIPTGVGKEIPVSIPCSIDYNCIADEFIKACKLEDAAPVKALELCS